MDVPRSTQEDVAARELLDAAEQLEERVEWHHEGGWLWTANLLQVRANYLRRQSEILYGEAREFRQQEKRDRAIRRSS